LHWVQTKQLDLPDDAVNWLDSISDEQLDQAYDAASVYLSMSEDEGFCLPILEAMSRRVLVFAYDQAAVRETLGSTGVLFDEKSFEHLARQLQLLLTEPDACRKIVDTQHERAHALMINMDGREYLEILSQAWTKRDIANDANP
jgi:glycosyltransferase involved in cell wall biosynthesis